MTGPLPDNDPLSSAEIWTCLMSRETIDVQTFARNLERYLETPLAGQVNVTTRFEDLPGWNSLQALIISASLEWDYGVTISADEFVAAKTVEDLHQAVVRRMAG